MNISQKLHLSPKYWILTALLAVLLLSGCQSKAATDGSIQASGFIEAQTIRIASLTGGQVTAVNVSQGDAVQAGDVLVQLDTGALENMRTQAQAGVTAAQSALNILKARPGEVEIAAAQAKLAEAQASQDSAQAQLDLLLKTYADLPVDPPDSDLHAAQSAISIAQANLSLAQAIYQQAQSGPTAEEIAIAQAKLDEAQANLQLVEYQIAQQTLSAPIAGVIGQALVKNGEIAVPSIPLVQLLDLQHLTVTVYLPETQAGKISPGMSVEVRVDAFPNQVFQGKVQRIADQAQFTPSNVQTQEERVKLVFAVEIMMDGQDGKLKPGMPADVTFKP